MVIRLDSEGALAALVVKEPAFYQPESKSFMRNRVLFSVLCAVFVWIACAFAGAQTAAPQPMITQKIDSSQLVVLKGNTHPLVQTLSDLGPASPDMQLHRMLLLLNRSSAQEASLEQLMDEQQEKDSPNFHHWLTPDEFGQQFGASTQDLQTIESWLQSNGFQVTQVARGRNVIEFSGTAGQVQAAFHTAIHSYLGSDGAHWANNSDPQIPAALAPAIIGIASLNNFPIVPHNSFAGTYSQNDHKLQSPRPNFTQGCGTDAQGKPLTCFAVSPWDFATIYDVLPLWTGGTDGTGETIAIVGRSNVNPTDISTFRTLFDLPAADSNHFQVILNGPDPGLGADESEADIDVQWSGAVAKNAKIDFVVSESTETSDGVDLSALYIIDNNLAPILSESFGQCEPVLGTAKNAFYNSLWQQAAAQGISVFLSTGDSGAAGCDAFQNAVPEPATQGLAVSGLASTPFNTAVGGTDFNDATAQEEALYWNPTNDPTTLASAKSYIPETTWNNSCTNSLFVLEGFSTNAETNCNNTQLTDFVLTVGGSGGVSTVYPKPSWQTGTGVPSDGHRDMPDVSLFAGNGFVGNFYVICEADLTGGGCDINGRLAGFGGTSVATPAFAGIMAMVDQTMGGRQGNPNFVLYKLAANTPTAFHDVPAGSTIAMPCQKGSANCTVNVTADNFGVLSGYVTGTGYDLATGLGSVDANAMVTNWNTVTFKSSATTLSSPSPTTLTHGQQFTASVNVAAVSPATGTPTGQVSLLTSTGQSVGGFTLTSGTASVATNLLPGGTYTLAAHYGGDGTFGGSDSSASPSITVSPEASKTGLQFETFDLQGNQTSPNASAAVYGTFYLLRVNVTNSGGTACAPLPEGQSACPTGNVALTDNTNTLDGGNFVLNSLGYTEDQAINLNGGTHSLQAVYAGDNSFTTSTGTDSITITPAATSFASFTNEPPTANTVATVSLTATVTSQSFGNAPTGTITFLSDGTPLTTSGAAIVTGTSGASTGTASMTVSQPVTFSSTGTHTITATYSGDGNYSGSTSASSFTVVVAGAGSDFVISSPSTVTASRGTAQPVSITIAGQSNYTGTVTFSASSCTGLPSETTCGFSPAFVVGSGTTTLTIVTTAPHVRTNTQADTSHGMHWLAITGGGMLSCVFLLGVPRKRRYGTLLSILFFAFMMTAVSCGGGGSSTGGGGGGGGTTDPGTPTGTYTVTVTATSGSLTHTTQFSLTVQ